MPLLNMPNKILKCSFFFLFLTLTLFLARGALINRLLSSLPPKTACGCDPQNASGQFQFGETFALFHGQKIKPPPKPLKPAALAVLGETAQEEEKWIEVDLSEQKLRAWEGENLIMQSLVSTGKWAKTPEGTFRIALKYRYIKMSGGSPELGTYYYLPNVPYVMFFANRQIPVSRGFSLHGTYWHNNFGQPMSHGCVNLPIPAAEKLFAWANPQIKPEDSSQPATPQNPGTRVIIHE